MILKMALSYLLPLLIVDVPEFSKIPGPGMSEYKKGCLTSETASLFLTGKQHKCYLHSV